MVCWRFAVRFPERRNRKTIMKRDWKKILNLYLDHHLYPSQISKRTGLKVGEIIGTINRFLKKE